MEYSEKPLQTEHAYNVSEKSEARRKLMRARAIAGGALLSVAGLMAVGGATIPQQGASPESVRAAIQNETKTETREKYVPDSYYNGKVEIVMSDNLNVRKTPLIINTEQEAEQNNGVNTVNWSEVEEIKSQGNEWVKVKGNSDFVIEKPLITEGEDPEGSSTKGSWITFIAKVNQPFGDSKEETLYVSFSSHTSDYVKPLETGSMIKITGETQTQGLGTVILKQTP